MFETHTSVFCVCKPAAKDHHQNQYIFVVATHPISIPMFNFEREMLKLVGRTLERRAIYINKSDGAKYRMPYYIARMAHAHSQRKKTVYRS